ADRGVAHPRLALPGLGHVDRLPAQDFGTAVRMDSDRVCHARDRSLVGLQVGLQPDSLLMHGLSGRSPTYSAWSSVSPVRIRSTRSSSVMKILPSPTLPVFAAPMIASTTCSTSVSLTATSMRVFGTKSTTYSAPRYSSV